MELNEQTQKAFGVVSKEEAEEINRERSLFDKIFNPIESRVVSDDVKNLFLDPEVNLADLVATKRPEGISAFDVFSSDPKKRELALYGESKADRRDLLALKSDKDFVEEFANAQNERATLKRKESENSFRNTGYDFLTERLNLDPSTAQGVVTAAEFVPFLGDLPMIEDAVDQFKRGDIKEGALTTLLATAGIAFDGIPLIVNSIKKTKTGISKKEVTPEEDALSSPLIPKMFVGEKSKFADKVASKEIMESRKLTQSPDDSFGVSAVSEFPDKLKSKIYNNEAYIADAGPNKGKLVERVPETDLNPDGESIIPMITSAERLQDSKNTFRKFYRDNKIMHSGDIITDLKKMPEEQREKTKAMLRELWLKNGWTVGKNNKFYTEVDDSYLSGTPFNPSADVANKYFKFRLFLNEQKQDLVNGGLTLPRPLKDVFAHPKLYEAYPQLKNLAIRVMTKDDSDAFDRIGGHYSYDGRDGVSEIVMKVDGFDDNDFNVARVKKLSQSNTFTEKFMETLIHELQHAVQHIEGLNYATYRNLNKSNVMQAKLNLKGVLPSHLERFKKADAKLKSLNPKDYDPKDNYSEYKMAERARESAKDLLESRAYKLDELNNLDIEDEFSDVNYYDTVREVEARVSGNRLYYGMDARMETVPFDNMTTQSKGISGLDILRRASADKNGRVDFDKYHKMRTKVLQPIFKQKEEGEKFLDRAFEKVTGIKFEINEPSKYDDWTYGTNSSLGYNKTKNYNNLTDLLHFGKISQKDFNNALTMLDVKLANVGAKVEPSRDVIAGYNYQLKSPYVLVKFSDETNLNPTTNPNYNLKDIYDEGSFSSKKDPSINYEVISFKGDDGKTGEYFFVQERDLVYNTLHKKRMPTEYKTVKGEVESVTFDQERGIKKVYEDDDPFMDKEEWIKENLGVDKPNRVANTDDNVTFNFYNASMGSNNNFSTHPLLRTLLKRQSTSGPAGVNKFNRINMTTQKLKPRVRRRKFKDSEKFLAPYKDDYNASLNEWTNDMIMRKDELLLEQIKDYDLDKFDYQKGLESRTPPSEYKYLSTYSKNKEGQSTIEEIFPQVKSPYDGIREIKDPVYLPDDYDYTTSPLFKRSKALAKLKMNK